MNSIANSKSKDKYRNSLFLIGDKNNKLKDQGNCRHKPDSLSMSPVKIENRKIAHSNLKKLCQLTSELEIIQGTKALNMNNLVSYDSFYDHMITKYCSPKAKLLHKKNKSICKERFIFESPTHEKSIPNIVSVAHFEIIPNKIKECKVDISDISQISVPINQIERTLLITLHSQGIQENINDKFPRKLSTVIITPRKLCSTSHTLHQSKVKYKNYDLNSAVIRNVNILPKDPSENIKKQNESDETKGKISSLLPVTANIKSMNSKSKKGITSNSKFKKCICF